MRFEFRNEEYDKVSYVLEIMKQESHYVMWELYRPGPRGSGDDNRPIISGSTKWDGCSDMQTQEGFWLHFCSLEEWKEFQAVLEWVYRTTYGVIENRDGELEE